MMRKVGKWFELLITIVLMIIFYICGCVILPTVHSFKENEEINNPILNFLVKQHLQNSAVYTIISIIVTGIISYAIYEMIICSTNNIFKKRGIQRKFDEFLNDACELYILGGDIDFLLDCNTQLKKIESLGEKCKILCKKFENNDRKKMLKAMYKRLCDKKVNIRRYDQETDEFHNLRGQIKVCKDGTYECLLVVKMDKKGKFKVMNLENQFLIKILIENFDRIYENARNPLISTILFDMGGVYFDGDLKENFLDVINSELSLDIKWARNQKLVLDEKLNLGEKTIVQWVEGMIRRDLNSKEKRCIEETWKNTWKPNPLMNELVENLKRREYEVGILSNMDAENGGYYNEKGYLNVFSIKNRFLSYEYKILKPSDEFYERVCEKMDLEPYEILFIDDHEKNVDTALDYGIHAIQFSIRDDKEILNLKKELNEHLIKFE